MPSIAPLDSDETEIGHVECAGFLGDAAVFAGVEGAIHMLSDRHLVIPAHEGLLAAEFSFDQKSLVTSGEDGKVCALDGSGQSRLLFEKSGWWIDKLACGPSGAVAFGTGKKGIVLKPDGAEKAFDCERSIEGLAFAPKGMRLAIARYNGVELNWINTSNPPQFLEWNGAHTGVIFSLDGKYVVSMMQENALHGWRIIDNKHMRMTGYPAKVKSLSFSAKGKWLASSGAPAAIVWPFSGKDGPMGKAPKELGAMGGGLMVTHVTCHPEEEVVAIGYSDGMVLAVRIEDGKEAMLKRAGNSAISALGWDASGTRIAYGSETGEAGIIDLKG
ncbi:MAG: WD40 repeat domain-containing protein [Salaquimonas sp.]